MKALTLMPCLILGLCSIPLANDNQNSTAQPICFATEIPIQDISDDGVAQISNVNVVASPGNPIYSNVQIKNQSSEGIQQIALAVEYFDKRGDHLGEISFNSEQSTGPDRKAISPPFVSEYSDESFPKPLLPERSASLHGVRTETWRECPGQAVVTFLSVKRESRAAEHWNSLRWKLGPIVNYFPERLHFELAGEPSELTFLRVRLRLDAAGKVISVRPLPEAPIAELSQLADFFGSLEFIPAIDTGHPVESEITVQLQFLAIGSQGIKIDSEDHDFPEMVMKALPVTGELNSWQLWFGWRTGGSSLK